MAIGTNNYEHIIALSRSQMTIMMMMIRWALLLPMICNKFTSVSIVYVLYVPVHSICYAAAFW